MALLERLLAEAPQYWLAPVTSVPIVYLKACLLLWALVRLSSGLRKLLTASGVWPEPLQYPGPCLPWGMAAGRPLGSGKEKKEPQRNLLSQPQPGGGTIATSEQIPGCLPLGSAPKCCFLRCWEGEGSRGLEGNWFQHKGGAL